MNVNTGRKPIQLSGFKGMYSRGLSETCPKDHFTDCYNCNFPGHDQIDIREPFLSYVGLTVGRQVISFFIGQISSGPVLLTLDNAGNLRDETNHPSGSPLYNFTGNIDDFTAISAFGRVYISPKFQGRSKVGEHVYYYDGSIPNLIQAAGVGPVLSPSLTQTAITGATDPGVHQIAVSYLYRTGYLSPPCPLVNINANGTNGIELLSVPTGGLGVVGRVILMSQANQSVLYFVPGGTINDNVSTTFIINCYDVALISSADYLNRILSTIPSCSAMKFYNGRMVYIGLDPYPDQLLVSQVELPENLDSVQGVVNMPVDYGPNNCNGGTVLQSTLYITKPSGTYAVQDNGLIPNNWSVVPVDTGIGGYDAGISAFSSGMSASDILDISLIAGFRGLMLFNGVYQDPPLTYKIESIWQLISPQLMHRVQIAHDIWHKRVYIAVPLSGPSSMGVLPTQNISGMCGMILMMDYQDGLSAETVKWSGWYSSTFPNIYKCLMQNTTAAYTGLPSININLLIANNTNNIFTCFAPNANIINSLAGYPDANPGGMSLNPINQYVITAPISFDDSISTFTMIDLDITGTGLIAISAFDRRKTFSKSYLGFNLTSYSGQFSLQRLINFTSEALSVSLQCSQSIVGGLNGRMQITGIDIYGKPMWGMRPALVESA